MPKSTPPPTDLPRLAAPAQRALAGAGITNLKQLSKYRETDIQALHGIGPSALESLRAALAAQGLAYRGDTGRQK